MPLSCGQGVQGRAWRERAGGARLSSEAPSQACLGLEFVPLPLGPVTRPRQRPWNAVTQVGSNGSCFGGGKLRFGDGEALFGALLPFCLFLGVAGPQPGGNTRLGDTFPVLPASDLIQ